MAPRTRSVVRVPCGILYPQDKAVLAGAKLGLPHKANTELLICTPLLGQPCVQLTINFERKETAEATYNRSIEKNPKAQESKFIAISVRFPAGSFMTSLEPLSDDLHKDLFSTPVGEKKMGVIHLALLPGAKPVFVNTGSAFIGQDGEASDTVSGKGLFQAFRLLSDVLRQTEFDLLVKDCGFKARADVCFARDLQTDQPSGYPYGEHHDWDLDRYKRILDPKEKGAFQAIYAHDSANHALTAITQSRIQDVFFLSEDVTAMRDKEVQARFVRVHADPTHAKHNQLFYAVVKAPFAETYSVSFNRLNKSGSSASLAFSPSEAAATTDGAVDKDA